jgi:hypothetical protein
MVIPEATAQTAAFASDAIWVASSRGDFDRGITLPPGGVPEGAPADTLSGRRWRVQRPAYFEHGGRDLRLDLIRGFLVATMIVNHLPGESPSYLLTGGNRFFTSAAEGFLLLSGLMAGIVYRRAVQRYGLLAGLLKVLKCAATLYALTVTVTLLFTVYSEVAGLPWPIADNHLFGVAAWQALFVAGLILPETGPGSPWLTAAIQIAGVVLVLLLFKRKILMPNPATRLFWHASPALASLLIVALLGAAQLNDLRIWVDIGLGDET